MALAFALVYFHFMVFMIFVIFVKIVLRMKHMFYLVVLYIMVYGNLCSCRRVILPLIYNEDAKLRFLFNDDAIVSKCAKTCLKIINIRNNVINYVR